MNANVERKMKTLTLISIFLAGFAFAGMEELKEIVPEESSWFTTVASDREAAEPSPKSFEAMIIKSLTGFDSFSLHTTYCLAIEITDSSLPEWEIGQKRVLIVDRWYGGANPMRDEPFRDGEKIRMLVFGIEDGEVCGIFEPPTGTHDKNAQQTSAGNGTGCARPSPAP